MTTSPLPSLNRRLMPLYATAFLQSLVLFYAIEKLFMHTIGFNDAGIGVMAAAYLSVMLILETPSGILADRWSRKGVLVIAGFLLAISALLGGLSAEPYLYVVSALFWGAFYALYSGTYDTIIYDTVVEHTGSAEHYQRYYGRIKMIESIGLVISAVIGGLVAQHAGLPAAYFWTIPTALLSLLALARFREPTLHKHHMPNSIRQHTLEMFKAILGKRQILRLITVIIATFIVTEMLYEFSQLWFIALSVPAALFGIFFGAVLASTGAGGFVGGRLPRRPVTNFILLTFMLASSLCLAFVHNAFALVAAQIVLGTAGIAINILLMRDFHDTLPAHFRAGSSSAIGTISRIIIIPSALLFGVLSATHTVFASAWIIIVLVVIAIVFELKPIRPEVV